MSFKPAYETATFAKFKEIRGEEAASIFPQLMQIEAMATLVQMAFEAGRTWQHTHPYASVDFPDYGEILPFSNPPKG
jgi:hypothetical protein